MSTVTRRALLALAAGATLTVLGGCRRAQASTAQTDGAPSNAAGLSATAAPATSAVPLLGARLARAAASGRSVQRLTVGGVERRYVRYAPAGQDETAPAPLVLVLHGRGGSGSIAERMYNVSDLAQAHGFVVAYPDALGDPPTWNEGFVVASPRRPDDVGFIRALVEHEAQACPIDPSRTFVCGHSSGGMMTYRLAAEASDLFAAAAVVAGSVGYRGPAGRVTTVQQPAQPVSIIHVHGTDDRLVPYQGGGDGRGAGGFLSVADSVAFWVAANSCDPTPTTETLGAARRETYTNAGTGTEVTLWTVEGGSHTWPKPQTPVIPPGTVAGISATELTWAFFAAHPHL